MAITYGFFNSVNGDRKYSAKNIGRYLHGIVSSGVYADTSTSLQVLAGTGMQVQVLAGRAMLDYHYMENDAPLYLTIDYAGTQDRCDAIMAVLDVTNRLCKIEVKKGTEAASPTPPAVTRSDTIKEYMLAYVYVGKYASAITQENITDTRADNSVCGWVHGLIQQVDTSTLFAQYEEAYANKMAELLTYINEQKKEIDSRLDSIDSAINSNQTGVPIPTASNVGMVPTVRTGGTGYKLATPLVTKISLNSLNRLNLWELTEDDVGLRIIDYYNSGTVAVKNDAGEIKTHISIDAFALCYISYSQMLSGGVDVGKKITLYDYKSGRVVTQDVRWDSTGTQTEWDFSVSATFVKTVNNNHPDYKGNVSM